MVRNIMLLNLIVCLTFLFATADCAAGCTNGSCNYPGECYCHAGFSGPLCNVPSSSNKTLDKGLGKCVYSNVTSPCKVANGQRRYDCPVGYSVVDVQACQDIPGYDANVCGKSCCDGWAGEDCATGLVILRSLSNGSIWSSL